MPDAFWRLTPWQFKCCVRAAERQRTIDHKDELWIIWHSAALQRQKTLMPLEKLIADPKNKKAMPRIDENAILARMKAYQADRDKGKGPA